MGYLLPGIDSLTQLELVAMQKTMLAKYPGKCAISGARINPGDEIIYDTVAKKAFFSEPGDSQVDSSYLAARTPKKYISDVYNVGGREYYRNKQGLCIDAPCCGCCTF
jgi:hypothetical protein